MPWKSILASFTLVAAVLVALGFFWPFGHRATQLHLPGVVEIQEVRLGSKIGGRVSEVLTREGDMAQAGQVLVRFEAPEIEAQRDQLRARVESLKAEMEKAIHGPRPEEIRQARSDLETAEADLKLAREDLTRIERLFRSGGSDRAEYDAARASRDRTVGRAGSARAKLDLLNIGTRPEDIAAAKANYAEAQGKLAEIQANLGETVVRAPEQVVVEIVAVRKGDLVPPNQPVVRVLRGDDMWIKVYVPETELGKVHLGQQAEVMVDAYPSKHFAGTIIQIASESEFTPRNVQSLDERRYQVFGVKVHVADPQGVFKSGMAAMVLFELPP